MVADAVDKLTHDNPSAGVEVDLEMTHKSQLRALLAHCHELSQKKHGGIATNAPARESTEFKAFRATSCGPAQPIVPWWKMTLESEGLANWNKSIKPNSRDFKPFGKMNVWVEHKESVLVTLEAQNLADLVEKNPVIHDGSPVKPCSTL